MRDNSPARGFTTARPSLQLQPFWKREDGYMAEALAGTFASNAVSPDAVDRLTCALSKLICDGQQARAAYNILEGLKKHTGPFSVRAVQVEFEYEHTGARRANGIPFYVLARASVMESILPEHTAGRKTRPLPENEIGVLQAALEKATRPETRPVYNPVRPDFWLGDLCEKEIGLLSRTAPRILAAGVFERESGAFASPDRALIEKLHAACEEYFPTPKIVAANDAEATIVMPCEKAVALAL